MFCGFALAKFRTEVRKAKLGAEKLFFQHLLDLAQVFYFRIADRLVAVLVGHTVFQQEFYCFSVGRAFPDLFGNVLFPAFVSDFPFGICRAHRNFSASLCRSA